MWLYIFDSHKNVINVHEAQVDALINTYAPARASYEFMQKGRKRTYHTTVAAEPGTVYHATGHIKVWFEERDDARAGKLLTEARFEVLERLVVSYEKQLDRTRKRLADIHEHGLEVVE